MMTDKGRWTKANPDGWGGDGIGTVMQLDRSRRGFGAKGGDPGPALLFQLAHNGLTVWLRPEDVEPLT
jgi:hypothetical protein